ncbi:sensor histidine kinase [Candidatus Enterococcus moelleringii]|uniref:sensor histidine kinase n=1 Tax=Candidatus Enterococcus moelleringii TaxID=2815325 RepID=UPI001F60BC3D|nr:HAMP domain-containing sensor histidine kinase [Enterococcus sp. 669A]
MNYQRNSLTRSFIQRVGIIFIVIVVFFALFYRWGFPTYYYWKMEQPVKEAQQLIQNGKEDQLSEDIVVVSWDRDGFNSEDELNADLTFQLGQAGVSLNRFWVDATTIDAAESGRSVQRLYNQSRQRNDFYAIFFIEDQNLYLIGTSIPDFQAAIRTLMPILIATTILFLVLLFGLIVLLVRNQIIKPIGRLEQATRNISNLNFAGSDIQEENELGSLSQSINQMKRSLQQHEMEMLERNDQLKAFSSNLAHELKTPLSVMQLLVDGEQMGLENPTFLQDVDQQLADMNELVAHILAYSQQMKEDVQLESVEIQALVEKELKQQQLIDPKFQVTLAIEPCQLETNQQLMGMILLNLLTNGMKYSLDKQMTVTGKRSGNYYQLTFQNKATEMSYQQFSQLTEPFVVGEASRNNRLSGTGLGLSIVQQSLRTLGGELILRQENGYFIAGVTLPVKRKTVS